MGLTVAHRALPEWEKETSAKANAVISFGAMNNVLMQVRNAHGVVLERIEVERTFQCCSQFMQTEDEIHDVGCMGEDSYAYAWHEITIQAKEPLQPTASDLGKPHGHVVPFQASGSKVSVSGHKIDRALAKAMNQFQMMSPCTECGNLFCRRNQKDDDSRCVSCHMQTMLTPARLIDCSICLESTARFLELPCGHAFHYRCIARVPISHTHDPITHECKSGRACPNCRRVHASLAPPT